MSPGGSRRPEGVDIDWIAVQQSVEGIRIRISARRRSARLHIWLRNRPRPLLSFLSPRACVCRALDFPTAPLAGNGFTSFAATSARRCEAARDGFASAGVFHDIHADAKVSRVDKAILVERECQRQPDGRAESET